jgi:hypothetical protein
MSISFQAGLFSAVLTAFVVPKIQDLKVDPADQSAYYQNQTVHMLDRISQQLASMGDQISTNSNSPLPYPTFHASASDRRVNILWLISLVCSLSAALLATLVQQWARAYMRVFQHSKNPLKAARIQLFLLEGAERLPSVAEFVPGLIHISLILFLWGLCDIILYIDKAAFITTVAPILICVCLYIYCVVESIRNPQSPYRTPFSPYIWRLIQILRCNLYNRIRIALVNPVQDLQVQATSLEAHREQSAMEQTEGCKNRDVRAIQWLVNNTNGNSETQAFLLAIPGSFNQEWGRDVWKKVVSDDLPTSSVGQPRPGLPSIQKGTTVYRLSRCVRKFFERESEGYFIGSKVLQRTGMRRCIETAASLVCCADVKLDSFEELTEMLRDVGDKEHTNDPSTIISNPLFTVRWTCLSIVAIWKMVDANMLQELAKFALDGFARLHTDYGVPDTMDLTAIAQRIDGYLMEAWPPVVDLNQAFNSEPWSLRRTESEIITILNSREESISELERIAIEALGAEDVDWRISFFQERMDRITHGLLRRLPGVFFNELKSATPIMIREVFDFPYVLVTPVPPLLIFPGQQIQSLCTLGRRLRDIIDIQNTETHEETLKSLESLREIPISLRELKHLMKRQLWRMLDIRNGRGLGFTIELFFLAVRQLSSTSSSSESELTKVFYTGTFEVVTSNWEKSKKSAETQRILLDILSDLVIRGRGVFSDFSYPPYIVKMLLDLVEKMVKGHGGLNPHINEVIMELEDENLRNRMDNSLRDQALLAIDPPPHTMPP